MSVESRHYEVIVLSEVDKELEDAYDWYLLVSDELAFDLIKEFKECCQAIVDSPNKQLVHASARHILLKRFPYAIYYNLDQTKKLITLLSFVHVKRNPSVWRKAIKTRRRRF